jgi:hypothetical protein
VNAGPSGNDAKAIAAGPDDGSGNALPQSADKRWIDAPIMVVLPGDLAIMLPVIS